MIHFTPSAIKVSKSCILNTDSFYPIVVGKVNHTLTKKKSIVLDGTMSINRPYIRQGPKEYWLIFTDFFSGWIHRYAQKTSLFDSLYPV